MTQAKSITPRHTPSKEEIHMNLGIADSLEEMSQYLDSVNITKPSHIALVCRIVNGRYTIN